MSRYALVLGLTALFLTACGRDEAPAPPVLTPPEPVITEPETPTIEIDIDEDAAFEAALNEVSIDEMSNFNEVIDDLDADLVQAAEPGAKLAQALASEEEAEAVVAAEIRQEARAQIQSLDSPTGLQIRPYSDELYLQVKGVRPAVVYFTSENCETCATWEATLRENAAVYADSNALVLLVDFDTETELATRMRITEPGYGMMLTGMGEMMGPRPTDRLTAEDLAFIFQ